MRDKKYSRVALIQKFPPYFRFYRCEDVAEILGIAPGSFKQFLHVNPQFKTKKNSVSVDHICAGLNKILRELLSFYGVRINYCNY